MFRLFANRLAATDIRATWKANAERVLSYT